MKDLNINDIKFMLEQISALEVTGKHLDNQQYLGSGLTEKQELKSRLVFAEIYKNQLKSIHEYFMKAFDLEKNKQFDYLANPKFIELTERAGVSIRDMMKDYAQLCNNLEPDEYSSSYKRVFDPNCLTVKERKDAGMADFIDSKKELEFRNIKLEDDDKNILLENSVATKEQQEGIKKCCEFLYEISDSSGIEILGGTETKREFIDKFMTAPVAIKLHILNSIENERIFDNNDEFSTAYSQTAYVPDPERFKKQMKGAAIKLHTRVYDIHYYWGKLEAAYDKAFEKKDKILAYDKAEMEIKAKDKNYRTDEKYKRAYNKLSDVDVLDNIKEEYNKLKNEYKEKKESFLAKQNNLNSTEKNSKLKELSESGKKIRRFLKENYSILGVGGLKLRDEADTLMREKDDVRRLSSNGFKRFFRSFRNVFSNLNSTYRLENEFENEIPKYNKEKKDDKTDEVNVLSEDTKLNGNESSEDELFGFTPINKEDVDIAKKNDSVFLERFSNNSNQEYKRSINKHVVNAMLAAKGVSLTKSVYGGLKSAVGIFASIGRAFTTISNYISNNVSAVINAFTAIVEGVAWKDNKDRKKAAVNAKKLAKDTEKQNEENSKDSSNTDKDYNVNKYAKVAKKRSAWGKISHGVKTAAAVAGFLVSGAAIIGTAITSTVCLPITVVGMATAGVSFVASTVIEHKRRLNSAKKAIDSQIKDEQNAKENEKQEDIDIQEENDKKKTKADRFIEKEVDKFKKQIDERNKGRYRPFSNGYVIYDDIVNDKDKLKSSLRRKQAAMHNSSSIYSFKDKMDKSAQDEIYRNLFLVDPEKDWFEPDNLKSNEKIQEEIKDLINKNKESKNELSNTDKKKLSYIELAHSLKIELKLPENRIDRTKIFMNKENKIKEKDFSLGDK